MKLFKSIIFRKILLNKRYYTMKPILDDLNDIDSQYFIKLDEPNNIENEITIKSISNPKNIINNKTNKYVNYIYEILDS
jgi:hypothetical protein